MCVCMYTTYCHGVASGVPVPAVDMQPSQTPPLDLVIYDLKIASHLLTELSLIVGLLHILHLLWLYCVFCPLIHLAVHEFVRVMKSMSAALSASKQQCIRGACACA